MIMEKRQFKIIENGSHLEDFLNEGLIKVRLPDKIFSFNRGLHTPDAEFEYGVVSEKIQGERGGILIVIREYQESGRNPGIRLQHYCLSDRGDLMVDWSTPIEIYHPRYEELNRVLRTAHL